ncbi:unnamed protein product [Paramecium primaurelia]|uniref:Methyltransferase small domain-containing protein n=1 Tax=Paramecium primaurelia TaxID=5886 RepID=A0A8S1KA66_PARPR|nr:unnamed protein product [Paramecium primaurelia]
MKITLNKTEYKNIYVPNDDSYLFLDALKEEIQYFPQNAIVVEMGCGSGILIGNVSKLLQEQNNRALMCIGIDINYDACIASSRIMQENQIYFDCINSDGFEGLALDKLGIDIFIFNPPYVPTEDDEVERCKKYFKEKQQLFAQAYANNLRGQDLIEEVAKVNLIDCSYSGGKDGMLVTWKILEKVTNLMNSNGIIYLFVIQDNPINEIIAFFKSKGFEGFILKKQQKYNEIQLILKFVNNNVNK